MLTTRSSSQMSFATVAIAIAVLLSGCAQDPKPTDDGKKPPVTSTPAKPNPVPKTDPMPTKPNPALKADPTPPEPEPIPVKPLGDADIKATVDDYVTEHKKDPKAAAAKYKGKVIEVTGPVHQLWSKIDGARLVHIDVKTGFPLSCFVIKGAVGGTVVPGQTVRLKGSHQGDTSGSLWNCEILELGPDTAVRTSATELAKEYAADWRKASEKYRGKGMVVTGDVISKLTGTQFKLTLKGEGDVVVVCELVDDGKVLDKTYTIGSKASIAGNFSPSSGPNVILIGSGVEVGK